MNEESLIAALNDDPANWHVRLQVADLMFQRGAVDDLAVLIQSAPIPPQSSDQLQSAIAYAGVAAQQQAEAFVAAFPNDANGHFLLGQIYESAGHTEHAQHHYQTAQSLGMVFESDSIQQGSEQAVTDQENGVAFRTQNRKTGKVTAAIFAAVVVHAVILLIALYLIVFPKPPKEAVIVGRYLGTTSKKQEMVKKNVVKQVKKASASESAAAPVAKLMKANAIAKFALPDVDITSTGPLGLGDSGFGSFGGGGSGGGLGSGGSFFGAASTGQRFLFVLDHSKSMKKHQVELRNKELERALKSLDDGVQYQVLLFAGAAYYAQKGWEVVNTTQIKAPGGKKYNFKQKSIQDFDLEGKELPKGEWLQVSSSNRSRTMRFIENEKLFLGTDWGMALEIAHAMEPKPDVIFFMADGTGGNSPEPILAINAKNGRPVINTIAMQTTSGARQFNEVAKRTKGKFTIVDKKGKPIDGAAYLKNPNDFKDRL